MKNVKSLVDNFNNNHHIKDVIEICTGISIKGKSLQCPIHGGDEGASIHIGKNIFTCWSHGCLKGATPWQFIQAYYKLDGFKEVAKKVNSLFNTNIPIYEKGARNEPKKAIESNFNHIFKVNQYLSECNAELKKILEDKRHILLNAGTGAGKTYGIVEMLKPSTDDYIIFLVPTRSLAEQIAKDYNYFLLYGDMTEDTTGLKESKYIVATYNKVPTLERFINRENEFRALTGEVLISYTVVADEIHELMSKRVLLGSYLSRETEELIINADSSILMSANTNYIYEAYKEKLFNSYISVEKAVKSYNLDNLYIYRIPSKENQKKALLLQKIIENLATHEKILIQEDNKSHLEEYKSLLDENGINSIVINSKSKNDDEAAAEEYKSIIEDSTLKNIVILCTSVLNAGVNINNQKVCSIMIQDKKQFDTQKIEQFMGRVRTEGNTGILFLNQGEKPKFKGSIDNNIEYYTKLAELKAYERNNHYFNSYGNELNFKTLKTQWNTDKDNDGLKEVSDCIYLDNNCLFKVDHVQIYEKSRLKHERFNYYDNEFVIEKLQGIKTKNIKIITLAPITPVKEPKELKEEVKLKDVLIEVFREDEAKEELFRYINGEIKPKDFKNTNCINLYNLFKDERNYRELIKVSKSIITELKEIKDSEPKEIFNEILKAYTTLKPKLRRENIAYIRRINIYNKRFKVNEDTSISEDLMYNIVRKNCDCFVDSRNSIKESKSLFPSIINNYVQAYKCRYENGTLFDKHNKEVNIKELKQEFTNMIKKIYECTEKMYLNNLR